MIHTDQMGNIIDSTVPFRRIISLVPSQTELLTELVDPSLIAGRTKFCIHPGAVVKDIPVVGGTKQFNLEKIDMLKPDLIIGNKEENYREGIEQLQKKYPVWMSDIYTIDDNYEMIRRLGSLLNVPDKADNIVSSTQRVLKSVKGSRSGNVLYFIWKNPYVVAGKNTFIDHMINFLGFKNTCIQMRYPEMDQYILENLTPDHVLLSSEPFPFSKKHVEEFRELFPGAEIHLVDGEMFSWYGSRLIRSGKYFEDHFFIT